MTPSPKSLARWCSALTALLCAGACSKDSRVPAGIQRSVALTRAASCGALLSSIQDTAVRQMRAELDSRGQAWGSAGGGGVASAPPPGADNPASFSTTNTQVAGVDEADFVKNDGTRILVLSGRTLYAAHSWPARSLALAGTLDLEGWPTEMFLAGDRATVFSTIWTPAPGGSGGPGPGPAPASAIAAPACQPMGGGCGGGLAVTKITVVDLTNLSAPAVVSEVYLPGSGSSVRRVGSSLRLVLGDAMRWPEGVRWYPDSVDPRAYQDPARPAAAIAALEDANEAVIRAAPLQTWLPPGERTVAGGKVDLSYQCGDFYLANAPERLGLVTVATLDLDHLDAGVSRTSIVGDNGVVYATAQRLYVASPHWWWWGASGQRDWTYVHAFDLTAPGAATYLGSGGVEGHLRDAFALDEHDDALRVATSTQRLLDAGGGSRAVRVEPGSRLSVLALRAAGDGSGNRLELVGEIPSLVEGERVVSSRFVGNQGYVVTFRNVDPLVTLDLSDPAHPRKVAELTIPGFSTYLQPMDDGHLLAIGEDVPLDAGGHADWSRRSLQLSIFDVSDLAHPRRTAQARVGDARASSAASWDHHAFNWYRPDPSRPGLLAIPFSDWVSSGPPGGWADGFVSDVRLFSIDAAAGAGGIVPLGALGMRDVFVQGGTGHWSYQYRPWVRRSVFVTDGAGATYVYAVSDAGLRSAALGQLDAPLATALFPRHATP